MLICTVLQNQNDHMETEVEFWEWLLRPSGMGKVEDIARVLDFFFYNRGVILDCK